MNGIRTKNTIKNGVFLLKTMTLRSEIEITVFTVTDHGCLLGHQSVDGESLSGSKISDLARVPLISMRVHF